MAAAHGAFAGVAACVFDKAVAAVPMQGLAEEVPHDAVVARAWAAAAQQPHESINGTHKSVLLGEQGEQKESVS